MAKIDRILAKINTINDMIKLLDEDIESVEDVGIKEHLHQRLDELSKAKNGLTLAVSEMRKS